jgi:hypothetical protein
MRSGNPRRTHPARTGADYKQIKIKSHVDFLRASNGDALAKCQIENAVQAE